MLVLMLLDMSAVSGQIEDRVVIMAILAIFKSLKLYFYIAAITAIFFAGWHSHSWYDAYKAQNIEVKAIDNLGKGESNIILFNEAYDKVMPDAKDDCTSKPIPIGTIGLLK